MRELPNNLQQLFRLNKDNKLWIFNSIISLAIAGFLSIFIVFLRTPYLTSFFSNPTILFRKSLIIHVNLSVLFWIINNIMFFISNACSSKYMGVLRASSYINLLSIILLVVSLFNKQGIPFLNNYVPILYEISFFVGLSLFLSSILINLVCLFLSYYEHKLSYYSLDVSLTLLFSIIGFCLSYFQLKAAILNGSKFSLEEYYELLFWGGGHILQFAFTQIFMVALIYMNYTKMFHENFLKFLSKLNLSLSSIALFIYFFYNITEAEHRQLFTDHMRYFGGIAPTLLISYIISSKFTSKDKKLDYANLVTYTSSFLFLFGGLLGYMIYGVNVVIPAHYHGSIVAITICLMGFSLMLPGIKEMHKLRKIQIWVYLIGQMMHIIGLAWSGGYGVMRKTPGEVQMLKAKLAMGLMGMGGLLAIIGGVLFVYIAYNFYYRSREDV